MGQSIGAGRKELAGQLAYMVTVIGMLLMTVTGILMYAFAPQIMALISPDPQIQALGASVLRIEAFAEPFFAAAMVVGGVFRGVGNTLFPSLANLISMWAIRIPMAAGQRSLNLSNSAAVVLYEALRQNHYLNLETKGQLHHHTW